MALPDQFQTPMSRVTSTLYQQYKQANPPRPGDPMPMVGPIQMIAGQDEGYQEWLSQNPIANAQAMAAQGVTVPTNIQRDVFAQANRQGISGTQLESMFGMPAGTAAATSQALGIDMAGPDRFEPEPPPPPIPIPPERTMADQQGQPIPPPPPMPQQRQEMVAQQIADSEARSRANYPDRQLPTGIGTLGQTGQQGRPPEQSDPVPPTYFDPATGQPISTPPPQVPGGFDPSQFSQEDVMRVVNDINSGQRRVGDVARQYGVSPAYVQNNLDQINQQRLREIQQNPPQLQDRVPTFRRDGNYTQDQVAQVTQMLQDGTMTFEEASDIYRVPVEQIQQNFAELSQQPPPPQTPGYETLPVEPPIPTPVTPTPVTPTPTPGYRTLPVEPPIPTPVTPTPTPVTPTPTPVTPTPVTPTGGGGGGSFTPGLDGLTIDMEGGAGTLTGGEGTFTPEIGGGGTPTLPDPNVTPPTVTPPTVTPPTVTPGGGGTQTFDTSTIAGLISKYKTAPDQITEADTRSLIDMAKQQNMDTSTLANMAGVSQDFLTQNLANLGYSADYLRSTPTTNLTPVNPSVTTPTGATTTIQREAPAIEARKLGIIDLAKTLAEKEPAGGLPAYQVAGLSPLEKEAYRMAQANRGVYQNATLAGAETLGQVKRGLQDTYRDRIPISDYGTEKYLSEYDPFVTSGVGTMLQARNQAGQAGQFGRNAALAGIGSLGEGRARTRGAGDIGYATTARGIRELAGTTGQFDPATGTSSYMNPYETAVIDAAMGDLTRAGEQQKQALRARAVQAGAFGGNRAALAESELDRNLLEQQAKTAAGLRAQGYGQAQQNAMTAFENAQQRGQRAGQLIGGMGTQAAQVGLQAGRGLGDFASSISTMGQQGAGTQLQGANTLGNLAGLTGRLGESRSKLGLQGVDQYGRTTQDIIKMGDLGRQIGINQGEMGRLGQDINIRDIASLEAAGQAERAANQRALDATRATRMQDIQEPYQRVGFMSDVLRGAPSSQMQMTKRYDQQPSAAAQAIGGIGSLAATAAGAKTAGII